MLPRNAVQTSDRIHKDHAGELSVEMVPCFAFEKNHSHSRIGVASSFRVKRSKLVLARTINV